MDWKDVGKMVAKVSPLVGAAMGGPAGAAIGSLVAHALGVEEQPDAIASAIATDPDAALKLKQMYLDNEKDIRAHAFSTLSVELSDTQNARVTHQLSSMPAAITVMLTLIVGWLLYTITHTAMEEGNREIAIGLFGIVFSQWGAAIQFWVGTTRSSAEKSQTISRLQTIEK